MAKAISDEIYCDVKHLIEKITHYKEGSDEFKNLEKRVLTALKKSDTMYFVTTKDIKTAVWSMSEKFMFHGFFKHSDHLRRCHDKYIDKSLPESELRHRLNVVKFLLCKSESPTTHFWKYPEKFVFIEDKEPEEERVDWGAYLSEGIERWSPVKDESFELSESGDEPDLGEPSGGGGDRPLRPVIVETPRVEEYDFRACRRQLLDTIQNGWFQGEAVCMNPSSDWFDANVGILWQRHLQNQVKDLIQIAAVTVISEYKVMREVLWQMWGPHNSTVFELSENQLVPRPNVTISSLCSMTFETFMEVFIPYVDLLHEFRLFERELEAEQVPETYRSYGEGLKKITRPVFAQLVQIEDEIREQESTMTLLKLASKLEPIFEPIRVLKNIHEEVVKDFKQNSSIDCALSLLTSLRRSLQFSLNKLEQDIRMALYLESLYYYFTVINAWLVKDDLSDYTQEFIILNENESFVLQEIDESSRNDGIIKIICDEVLQIGRNLHLSRLLGKYDGFTKKPESIHQEFVRKILEELSSYYGQEPETTANLEEPEPPKVLNSFDINRMGDWTNYVDMTDGFLVKAFESFFEGETVEKTEESTLFQKISKITTNLYPIQDLPEKVLSQILKERFTISGLMVKNLLIEKFGLDKQLEFLNHIYLFHEDLIFPFYRRLFEKMNIENSNWGNSFWLTSHLQDILMDLYPNFYEDCSVQVEDSWKQSRDSLGNCTLVSLQYEIKWPLSIIITKEHLVKYRELFHFILKIKWALYTINHLSFADLEPKKRVEPQNVTTKRLKYLRFISINILNSVQHYLFGLVFHKSRTQFELDFEKANDLKSLMKAHDDFIASIFGAMTEIRDEKRHGFKTLLKCVKMLKVMWKEKQYASPENLDNCYRTYKMSFDVIDSIVNPIYVFDY